jgi:hypothetical protein
MTSKREIDEVEVAGDRTKVAGPDKDDALQFALANEEPWAEEEERRVLRKIDMVLLPLVSDNSEIHYHGLLTISNLRSFSDLSLATRIARHMASRLCSVWSRT